MTRRDALWLASKALTAAGGGQFFAEWLRAAQAHAHNPFAPPEADRWTHYAPRFFSREDFAALEAFTRFLYFARGPGGRARIPGLRVSGKISGLRSSGTQARLIISSWPWQA